MSEIAALAAVSALSTGATAYTTAQAQKSAGAYQKQIADTNARLSEIQANDAITRGEKQATDIKTQTRKLIGAQRAALASQGLDLKDGNAADIQEETASLGAMDAMTVRNNAWREAWGYKVQANNYTGAGQMAQITAKNQANSTILTGGMSMINTAARASYYGQKSKSTDTVPKYDLYDPTKENGISWGDI
jgi:hypothetical protein